MGVSVRQGGLTLGPSTGWGRLSLALIAGFVVSTIVFLAAGLSGQQGGETFADNLWLSVPGFAGAGCAVLALLTGLVGLILRHERSLLVFVTTILGALVTIFLVGEIAVPH